MGIKGVKQCKHKVRRETPSLGRRSELLTLDELISLLPLKVGQVKEAMAVDDPRRLKVELEILANLIREIRRALGKS